MSTYCAEETIEILDLKAQFASIKTEINDAIAGVLDRQHFILGEEVATLESKVARFCGTEFGVGVASGTDALILALKACGVGPGDEVIVPAFTFVATADSVSMLGATPVFADIDPVDFTLDTAQLESLLTPVTKAVVPVHLYGHPAAMNAVMEFARRQALSVIEDAAQAMGARYFGNPVGRLADLCCLSFFPSKNLGAYGDGGMIMTADADCMRRLKMLRSHGSAKKYCSEFLGWNSRLDELQAAILQVKLPHLEAWNAARRRNAALYGEVLRDVEDIVLPTVKEGCEHVFHQYTVRVGNRDMVQQELKEAGVQTAVHYPIPLHLQPMYADRGYRSGDLPCAERACSEVLSLPMYPELSEEQIERVGAALARAVQRTASVKS